MPVRGWIKPLARLVVILDLGLDFRLYVSLSDQVRVFVLGMSGCKEAEGTSMEVIQGDSPDMEMTDLSGYGSYLDTVGLAESTCTNKRPAKPDNTLCIFQASSVNASSRGAERDTFVELLALIIGESKKLRQNTKNKEHSMKLLGKILRVPFARCLSC